VDFSLNKINFLAAFAPNQRLVIGTSSRQNKNCEKVTLAIPSFQSKNGGQKLLKSRDCFVAVLLAMTSAIFPAAARKVGP